MLKLLLSIVMLAFVGMAKAEDGSKLWLRTEKNVKVKKEKKVEEVKTKFINPKQHIRKALSKAYAKKKYVTIGGNK